MILYLGADGNHNMFFRKSDGGLNIYSNFSKIVIEGINNVCSVSNCFVINCDSSGKIWLELFEDIIFFIPFHVFFRSLMFSWKDLVK